LLFVEITAKSYITTVIFAGSAPGRYLQVSNRRVPLGFCLRILGGQALNDVGCRPSQVFDTSVIAPKLALSAIAVYFSAQPQRLYNFLVCHSASSNPFHSHLLPSRQPAQGHFLSQIEQPVHTRQLFSSASKFLHHWQSPLIVLISAAFSFSSRSIRSAAPIIMSPIQSSMSNNGHFVQVCASVLREHIRSACIISLSVMSSPSKIR
jgi:hypothetical protein